MLQALLDTGVQLLVALLLALIIWGAARLFGVKRSFAVFIGALAAPRKSLAYAILAALVLGGTTIALFRFTSLSTVVAADNSVSERIREMGLSGETIAVLLLLAVFKTALSEELVFRGLLAKRLIAWLGFGAGNLIQAAIFGAIHLLMFVTPGAPAWDPLAAGALFIAPFIAGVVAGYLNERIGGGSIAPSWFMHALSNLVGYSILAFT